MTNTGCITCNSMSEQWTQGIPSTSNINVVAYSAKRLIARDCFCGIYFRLNTIANTLREWFCLNGCVGEIYVDVVVLCINVVVQFGRNYTRVGVSINKVKLAKLRIL